MQNIKIYFNQSCSICNSEINHYKPYFATSPADFWRRWHISLSTWLKDYLYIPLGGNKKSRPRTYLNLFIVMFLGGLWHGASWNFVIWGILHGAYLAIHRVVLNRFPALENNIFFKSKLGKIVSILVTQYFIFLAWIAFRVNDVNDMLYSMEKYIFLDIHTGSIMPFLISHKLPVSFIILFLILHLISYKTKNIQEKISQLKIHWWAGFLVIILTSIIFFYDNNPEDFIYFRF